MEDIIKEGRTRREFLKGATAVVAGGVVVGVVGSQLSCEEWPGGGTGVVSYAKADAYIVIDSTMCCNCQSCMLACSLVHYGVQNTSLARTQVIQNAFRPFPEDAEQFHCRQCVYVPCIEACPSEAFHIDADNGNIRTIDEGACKDYQESIAPDVCRLCIEACPYIPAIAVWNHEEGVAMVCDLCNDAEYWSEEGGVDGKQACIEGCPMHAIALVKKVPSQLDTVGYNVDLKPVDEE